MSHREKVFCVCDGCGLEVEVTSTVVPSGWVSTIKQQHGAKDQHFCLVCWPIGYIAICNYAVNKGST